MKKGCGAHTDWGGITVLLQDDAGGLQVQRADGSLISAPPLAGTFMVNIDDLFARKWSGAPMQRRDEKPRAVANNVTHRPGRKRWLNLAI